jgi:hypothetical protein
VTALKLSLILARSLRVVLSPPCGSLRRCGALIHVRGANLREDAMNTLRSSFVGTVLLILPADAQEHRFEADPNVIVRENFVACDVLSQLRRVMDNPRSLLAGECEPLRAGDRIRVYVRRGPYVCIYPHDRISPCKWTHEKALSK